MSASNQKKLRKVQAEAYMTERQRKEAEDQKKLKAYTLTFWVVLALCVCIVIGAVVSNPIKNVVYTNTEAVTIGSHTLNAVTVNYFYIDAVNNYVSQYSSYISYILSTTTPLDKQVADKETGATWADQFLDMAFDSMKSTYALYDLAIEKGHKLTEDEQKSVDTVMSNLSLYAQIYGYKNTDAYLRDVYGNGATAESYKAYYETSAIADSYYNAYSDSLEYDADTLRAYEKGSLHDYNSYTYATYYLSAAKFYEGGTKDDKGNMTYTDEEKAAAAERAQKVANAIAAKDFETLKEFLTLPEKDEDLQKLKDAVALKTVEDFNTIVAALKINAGVKDVKATEYEDTLYSKINSLFKEWIAGIPAKEEDKKDEKASESEDKTEDDKKEDIVYEKREEGQMTVIVNETTTNGKKTVNGYYVVRYESCNTNTFNLKNVRHILIAFEGGKTNSSTGETTYTDAEKNKAKLEAEKLLNEWKNGAKTEDSFADLAAKESDDTGSKKDGGLYEDVYPGEMVEQFEDWCYDAERKVGDTGLVETKYGYHIMFYVGESETNYRDYMISNAKRAEDLEKWHKDLVEAIKFEELNLNYVDTGMIIGSH